MSRLLGIIFVVVLLVAGVYFFAPGLWDLGAKAYDERLGWGSEERRLEDPVGYLEYAEGRLQKNVTRIESIISDLHSHRGELESLNGELARNNAAYSALLDEARTLYREANDATDSYPVEFRGATYSKDEFLTQLEIILNQHHQTKQQLSELGGSLKEINGHVTTLHAERARGQGALESIRTAKVIARAQMATAEVRQTMGTVEDTMAHLGRTVSKYESGIPIRAAEDLIDAKAGPEAEVSRQELMKFLEGEQ